MNMILFIEENTGKEGYKIERNTISWRGIYILKENMLIQTLRGELLSIELQEREKNLECIKEKIAEMDPSYHPFTQLLFPLHEGPLRPFHLDDCIGLVQQRIRIQFSKPQFRILLHQDSLQFPLRDHVTHYLWLITIQYKRKKISPKKIVKNVFLYDPVLDRFTLHCSFVSKYHRIDPHYTFLLSRVDTIPWYSSLEEVMRSFHALYPSIPFSEAILDTMNERWAYRKKQLLLYHQDVVQQFELDMIQMPCHSLDSHLSFDYHANS